MTKNRLIGIIINHLPVFMIGGLLGPVSVSFYDTLMRIPRFMKAIMALASAAVFSLSARLTQRGDQSTIKLFSRVGIRFISMIAFPFFIGCAVFSKQILHFWVGPEISMHWPLLSALFLVPLLNGLQSFITQIGSVKIKFLAHLNRVILVQAGVFWVVSLMLLEGYGFRAFILASLAGVLVAFWLVARVYLCENAWARRDLAVLFLKHLLLSITLTLAVFMMQQFYSPDHLLTVVGMVLFWFVAYSIGSYRWILSSEDKVYGRRLLGVFKLGKKGGFANGDRLL